MEKQIKLERKKPIKVDKVVNPENQHKKEKREKEETNRE